MQVKNVPTQAERLILAAIFDGNQTVREIYDYVLKHKQVVYTCVLKQIQILESKGVVARMKKKKPLRYKCKYSHYRLMVMVAKSLAKEPLFGSMGALSGICSVA